MRVHEIEGVVIVEENEGQDTGEAPLRGRALELFTLLEALFGLEEAAGEERAAAEDTVRP